MYCKELTKEQLQKWGFVEPMFTSDGWKIFRYWYNGNSKNKIIKEISITKAVGKHKYTQSKVYLKLTFTYKQQGISISLSRFIYAWFNEIVPAGLDVEHIDNNPYNNCLSNLRLCTRSENLAKRFTDNPNNFINQWAAIKNKN